MPRPNQKPFPPDTAGSKMTSDIPVVEPQMSIGEVLIRIQKKIRKLETINYIYVVNHEKKLIGALSIKEIFRTPKIKKVKDLMKEDLITVDPLTDQEKVAYLALKHNLKAIPVVDHRNRFLGIVPSDILLKILYKETGEDILLLSGLQDRVSHFFKISSFQATKLRLPWLFFGLLGGIVSGSVIGVFKPTLESLVALVIYIPVMMNMGGNIGSQSGIIYMRNLIFEKIEILKYLLKEIKISFFIALICAVILSLVSSFWQGSPIFGLIIGLSMFVTILAASIIGVAVPYFLERFGLDPAIGMGPFITTVKDITSLLIYFTIASLMMRYFL